MVAMTKANTTDFDQWHIEAGKGQNLAERPRYNRPNGIRPVNETRKPSTKNAQRT